MSTEGNTSNLCTPEERNVYSKRESAPLVFLFSEAPAGRHVYRQATCLATQAPAGR